ncbi:SlyX protein [Herbaspirillum sp. Sphag1AN]|uniref:SlyX family protein n=1 Tax=unclassified Herbaspirillum TaxID=2624150 RepID=UPI00161D7A1C|nr:MULTISPECIES: SlyX family protein [unclassified Herbaspirillum]MBB3214897.1 SlyX protein [Herbaspirillum sp. Sphag1AN]MBB3248091.1 SlyX protein [Herbaspirillum sp. Sphag64]
MIDENRLIDIELKLTQQEDLVDALNTIVYRQQNQIDQLKQALAALAGQIKEAANSNNASNPGMIDHERPPHY